MSNLQRHDDAYYRRLFGEPGVPGGPDDFTAIVMYILLVGETPYEDLHQFFTQQVGPRAGEIFVTTADMLRAEGEARGRAEALLQLLTIKFGPQPDATIDAVDSATVDQLKVWTARVLTANTVDDVLS